MKKILGPLLAISLFIACKSQNKQADKNSTVSSLSTTDQTQELIKKFKPIIQGVWLKADYVNKMIRTKSPLVADNLATGITTFYINTHHIKGDSIVLNAVVGNHEGGDPVLKFEPGKSVGTILLDGGDLSYSIANGDTTLMLSQINTDTKTLDKPNILKY